jgi:integrase/recombinase XerD
MTSLSDNSPLLLPGLPTVESFSWQEAKHWRTEKIWEKFGAITVVQAIEAWLETLDEFSRINYRSGMNRLSSMRLIGWEDSLQTFSLVNHEAIIDRIKQVSEWSEATRQARAACYISFTGFLSRRYPDILRKAIPSREGHSKTFFKVREKVKTSAMSQSQWIQFLSELGKINQRDALIAKVVIQGGKRIREVLNLKTEQIDYEKREITFVVSKTKGFYKECRITYPQHIIDELRNYISDRTGYIFITRNQHPVRHPQLMRTFSKAGQKAKIPFKVTPHVLRASTVTYLKSQGFSDSDIMKVTGHASAEMICAYDKTSQADNISRSVNLV